MPNRSPPIIQIIKLFTYLTIITFYLKISFLIVLSGSMEPYIPTGSVICILKDVSNYQIGDIITYRTPYNSATDSESSAVSYVTHRITQTISMNNEVVYKTKGDANKDADRQYVSETQIKGKYLFAIPYLGYLVNHIINYKLCTFFFIICICVFFEVLTKHYGLSRKKKRN